MSYEKLNKFIFYLRQMQEAELDVLCITSSPKGFGKSSFMLQVGRRYMEIYGLRCKDCGHEWVYDDLTHNKDVNTLKQPCKKCSGQNVTKVTKFDFMRYLAYDNDEVYDMIHDLPPFSPLLPDEGVRFLMGEDWNTKASKQMKKKFAQMRTKRLLVFTNIPKFDWIDSKYRDDMATFWVRILKRGIAILMQPDLGEAEDPWHMKDFQKLLGSYHYFTEEEDLIRRADKIVGKHPCAFDWFKIPPVPKEIYAEYEIARNKKAFERTTKEERVEDKELAKIAAYNLRHRWDDITAAVKEGKLSYPSYRMLEEFIFMNPQTKESVIAHTTVRNMVNEVEKIVKYLPK